MHKDKFDHENLDVYQLELLFVSWVHILLEQVRGGKGAMLREVCCQLDRASISVLLNTAEGNGRRGTRQRAKFFDDARGSATECAACLDVLIAKGVCTKTRVVEGKRSLIRIVSMLSKLVHHFEQQNRST